MENMLAFEGVSLGGLDKTFESSPARTKTLLSSIGFSGYITVKASTSVWLYYVEDMYNDGVSITIGNALDGKLHDISHYAEWGVTQVPLPGAAWFFITGLVGIFGLNSITGRTEVIPITAEALVDFPQQLDDWSGSHDRIDDEVAEKLGFSDYVMLNYKNSDYQHINFYLAYYASQRKGLSPHSPKVCIPGGGWEIADFRRTNVDGIPVNRAIIRKGTQDQIVYYWFEERGVAVANEYLKKWMLFVDALLLNRTDGSLVRVTTPVMGNESIEEADLRAQSFIRLSRIQLSQFLPSHDLEGTN
jgi:EpsI family protein